MKTKSPKKPERQWPEGHAEFMEEVRRATLEQKEKFLAALVEQVKELRAKKGLD